MYALGVHMYICKCIAKDLEQYVPNWEDVTVEENQGNVDWGWDACHHTEP